MELLITHSDETKRLWSVSGNSTKKVVTTCGADGKISLYNTENSVKFDSVEASSEYHQNRSLRRCEISPCGNYVAIASFDSTISLWKIINDNEKYSLEYWQSLEGHESEVKGISWSRNGQYLATCARDKNVWIWELFDEVEFDCAAINSGHMQDVKDVSFAINQNNILASCSYDGSVRVWEEDGEDSGDWVETAHIDILRDGTVWSVIFLDELDPVFHAEYRLVLACVDSAGKVCIYGNPIGEDDWELISSFTLTSQLQPELVVYSICGDSSGLFVCCDDNSIRKLKFGENKVLSEVWCESCAHENDVNDLFFDKKDKKLYSVSDDRTLKIWKVDE